MSFSSNVKSELTAVGVNKKHCRKAEIAGIIYAASTLSISGKGMELNVVTENLAVVKRTISLIEKVFGISPELNSVEQLPKKTKSYFVKISGSENVELLMSGIGLKIGVGVEPDTEILQEITRLDCCKKAFLRGAFLGGGSISDPNKRYHLEIVMGSMPLADALLEVFQALGMNPGCIRRKDNHIVYIKEIEQIISFFTHIGAYSTILELENIRIIKNINNNINRAYNFENANIDRIVSSAEEQIKKIRMIDETIGLKNLAPSLQKTAELRLENPSASLAELAAIDGESSRSAINHRLRKIKEIANSIEMQEV